MVEFPQNVTHEEVKDRVRVKHITFIIYTQHAYYQNHDTLYWSGNAQLCDPEP